jgi:Rrf2 family protein
MILRRRGLHALKALLELAMAPAHWLSVQQLACAQGIPAPMLEQVVLQLRRAGLLEARRGRRGGYRLSRAPAAIPVAEVLRAVGCDPAEAPGPSLLALEAEAATAGERVASALERRLRLALERELARLSLEDLLYDLRSWQEVLRDDGGLMLG